MVSGVFQGADSESGVRFALKKWFSGIHDFYMHHVKERTLQPVSEDKACHFRGAMCHLESSKG